MIRKSIGNQYLEKLISDATEMRCELEKLEEVILFHAKHNKTDLDKLCDGVEEGVISAA